MRDLRKQYGQTALVAGASEGLGAAYCEALATAGLDLVMIARRAEPLEHAAKQIRAKHGVTVITIACDLADTDIISIIDRHLAGRAIDILVYNAALSHIGAYLDTDITTQLQIATVNMYTPMRLLHHYGGAMVQRHRGAVVMMASIAGFQGAGYLATYAATKAFDRVLAESLWYEWRGRGVDVIACCAGATATPNYLDTKPTKPPLLAPKVQSPEAVVAECLAQLGRVPSIITGSGNKAATWLMKVMPRKSAVEIMGDTTVQLYGITHIK
jgi:uncharacterized protein